MEYEAAMCWIRIAVEECVVGIARLYPTGGNVQCAFRRVPTF